MNICDDVGLVIKIRFGLSCTWKSPPKPESPDIFKIPVKLQLYAKYFIQFCDDVGLSILVRLKFRPTSKLVKLVRFEIFNAPTIPSNGKINPLMLVLPFVVPLFNVIVLFPPNV